MQKLTQITRGDIDSMSKVPRLKLINSLSGFKSTNLVGTKNGDGVENLAIFSSLFHLGSNPQLLGCILWPTTVARHIYDNLKANDGWYTFNHIHEEIYQQAHQTSGNYRGDISEFEISGLTPWYSEVCSVPYVEEARIRIGLQLEEEHLIEANGTRLLVGAIREVWLPEAALEEDNLLDIEQAGTVAISGLDAYHRTQLLDKMEYVRLEESKRRRDL